MKKIWLSFLLGCVALGACACAKERYTPTQASIGLHDTQSLDSVMQLGVRYNLPVVYARDELGNSYACSFTVLDPNGKVVEVKGGLITPSVLGEYTVTYQVAQEGVTCEPFVLKLLCTKSGEQYVLALENGATTLTGELKESFAIPSAFVYLEGEKVNGCSVSVFNDENQKIALQDGAFIPEETGEYTLVYDSLDISYAVDSLTISVIVTDSKAPVVSMDEFTGALKYTKKSYLPNFTVTDASEFTVVSTLINANGEIVQVDSNNAFLVESKGDYTWRITVTDSVGNTDTVEKIFTVDTYDDSVETGLLADYEEEFYATDKAFITDGKVAVYTGVQAIASVQSGALRLQKGTGTSKVGLQFARWIEPSENTYVYLKIKSNAESIFVGGLNETKLFMLQELTSFGFSYAEKDWQTVWIKASDLGLTAKHFDGFQMVFDGVENCVVELAEIGYSNAYEVYDIESNLSSLSSKKELLPDKAYNLEITVKNGQGTALTDLDIVTVCLEEDKASLQDSVFFATKSGEVTLRVIVSKNGVELTRKYIKLNVQPTLDEVLQTLQGKLGETGVALFDDNAYLRTILNSTLDDYNAIHLDNQDNFRFREKNGKYFRVNGVGGVRIAFASDSVYNQDGYLKVWVHFDNASVANTQKLLVCKYGATDTTNAVELTGFVNGSQYVYIPLKTLLNDDGTMDGLQFVFKSAGWTYLGEMTYDQSYVHYEWIESVSSIPYMLVDDELTLSASIKVNGTMKNGADIRYRVADETVAKIQNGKLKALKKGDAEVEIGYYENGKLCTAKTVRVEILNSYAEKLVGTLNDNELAIWDSTVYEEMLSALSVTGYDAMADYKILPEAKKLMLTPNGVGSGYTITFPKQNTYTSGYLKIGVYVDTVMSQDIFVYKLLETDKNAYVFQQHFASFEGAVGGKIFYMYIPVAELVDTDNLLKGVQIAVRYGKIYICDISYDADYVAYAISENISSLTIENGKSYDVSASVLLNGETVNGADIRYSVADESVLTIANGKLTAHKTGGTAVTIFYYDTDGESVLYSKEITLTVLKSITEQIADTLSENELALFNSALYAHTLSDLTVNGYNNPQTNEDYQIQWAQGNPLYKLVANANGTGHTVTFVKQNTYTDGYLRIRVNFDNAYGVNGKSLYIFRFGEVDATKHIKFTNFTIGQQYIYVPMSALVDENDILKGIQFSFTGGTWSYIGEMTYVETAYQVTENISALPELNRGNSYAIGAEQQGVIVTYTVENTSVDGSGAVIEAVKIENGNLIALQEGSAIITITYKLNESDGVMLASKRFIVTVNGDLSSEQVETGVNAGEKWWQAQGE